MTCLSMRKRFDRKYLTGSFLGMGEFRAVFELVLLGSGNGKDGDATAQMVLNRICPERVDLPV